LILHTLQYIFSSFVQSFLKILEFEYTHRFVIIVILESAIIIILDPLIPKSINVRDKPFKVNGKAFMKKKKNLSCYHLPSRKQQINGNFFLHLHNYWNSKNIFLNLYSEFYNLEVIFESRKRIWKSTLYPKFYNSDSRIHITKFASEFYNLEYKVDFQIL